MSEYKKIDKFGRYKAITGIREHSDPGVVFSDQQKITRELVHNCIKFVLFF